MMYLAPNRTHYHMVISDSVMEQEGGLLVGSSTTFGVLYKDPAIRNYPALHMALRMMVNPTSRRQKMLIRVLKHDVEVQGTLAAMMALDTQLLVVGPKGERTLSMTGYFCQEGGCLKPGESVRSFFIPGQSRGCSIYQSVDYLRSGQAVCGVAIWARCSDTFEQVSIVLSGCTPHPVPLLHLSAALQGKECTPESIDEATRKLGEERLIQYNPSLTLGSHLFNLSKTLIKRALYTL